MDMRNRYEGVVDYPPAAREPIVERLAGGEVADPYRWLEDSESAPTRAWAEAQDRLWRSWIEAHPARRVLRARLESLTAEVVHPPVGVGGRRFWTQRDRGQDHAA